MKRRREIEWVELESGRRVPAATLVCPTCKVLDLDTGVDVTQEPPEAKCSKGHTWRLELN